MEIANRAGERLSSVTGRIAEIDGMNQSVATATEEQTAVVDSLNMDITEINTLNQEGVENPRPPLRACGELENLGRAPAPAGGQLQDLSTARAAANRRIIAPRLSALPQAIRRGEQRQQRCSPISCQDASRGMPSFRPLPMRPIPALETPQGAPARAFFSQILKLPTAPAHRSNDCRCRWSTEWQKEQAQRRKAHRASPI